MSERRPLRVLSIAHTAVSRDAGRLRYYPFGKRDDLDVHLVVPNRWTQFGRTQSADAPTDPGISVHVLPIRFPHAGPLQWYLHYYRGLRQLFKQLQPDVIHLWEEPWSLVALQACFVKGDVPLVMEVDQNILKKLPPPFEAIRRYVVQRTDHVLARSADAAMVVRACGYRGPVDSIGYGVDRDTFAPRSEAESPDRLSGFVRIGYVGRLVIEKGLDDALDAMARCRASVEFSIMGEGPYERALRDRVQTLGLQKHVTFRPWGSPADVARFIRGQDAIVLLTRATRSVLEQFGRIIVEAQSCGIPVIGANSGAIPNVIGEGGWIVPERDPDALALLLDRLADEPESIAQRSLAALRNVGTRFTYDAVANDLARAWIAAAGKRNSTRCGRSAAPLGEMAV